MSDMSELAHPGFTENGEARGKKRVRKGTRSCWECKRRKIRCIFPSENDPTCLGCLDRGTNCLSQEYPDDHQASSGSRLGQRMGRVEQLLEQLMQKINANENGVSSHLSPPTPATDSLGIDVLTPSSTPSVQYENAPILSLFDNVVFGRSNTTVGTSQGLPSQNPSSSLPTPKSMISNPVSRTASKLDTLRRTLAPLLPSQKDFNAISGAASGWWLIRRHVLPDLVAFEDRELSRPYDVADIAESHPNKIGRLLLCVALCLQQLPKEFDHSSLSMPFPPKLLMEKCISTVSTLVTSDDELVGCFEGLECLILQAAYHINGGNLRRAWLCFRRALNVAQLMGLHRSAHRTNKEGDTASSIRGKYIWYQVVKGDRYLALILGVPAGVGGDPFIAEPEGAAHYLSPEDIYTRKLCLIAGLLLERNTAPETHAFATTQNIDEKLEALSKEMPPEWWEIPEETYSVKTELAAQVFDRLLAHIWHFQLEALVHLPFMIRAATERRYEYSKYGCLKASRQLIKRWDFLRNGPATAFVCHIIDFQAFTCAVTLILGLLGPMDGHDQQQQRDEDHALVRQVMNVLDQQAKAGNDSVATQCVEVLKTLMGMNEPQDGSHSGNLRLTIPYFGTISVARAINVTCTDGDKKAYQAAEDAAFAGVEGVAPHWQQIMLDPNNPQAGNAAGGMPQAPLLAFQSSQFLGNENYGDWVFKDADVMLFDSLVNSDVEGNWNFP